MQDSIQIHLKGGKGPIVVWTCDIGTGDKGEKSGGGDGFVALEESRIKTTTLQTGNHMTEPRRALKTTNCHQPVQLLLSILSYIYNMTLLETSS